jgi:hypothetical protein
MDTQDVPKKKKFYKKWWVWVLAAIVLFMIIGASSGGSKGVSVPAPSETGSSVAGSNKPAQQASAEPQVLLDLSGNGTKTTQKFTAGGDWDLNWSYDCSNFGYQGNFIVMIYDGNGSLSFSNTGINQLGMSDSGVEHYHNRGTYYLVVNSTCSWKVQVKG